MIPAVLCFVVTLCAFKTFLYRGSITPVALLQNSQDHPHIERVRLWLYVSREVIRLRCICARYWRAGLELKEGTVLVRVMIADAEEYLVRTL